jgi:vanillate O-demethylase monooxygenase subunit
MFPKNIWYVACTPDEIDGKPLGRKVCGESIVFYRAVDNRVAALEDFCPRRGAGLSLGFAQKRGTGAQPFEVSSVLVGKPA